MAPTRGIHRPLAGVAADAFEQCVSVVEHGRAQEYRGPVIWWVLGHISPSARYVWRTNRGCAVRSFANAGLAATASASFTDRSGQN
ncbi:hypothetical protein MSIMFI_05145 [Mycobacterium simulans]|nr:hypothetical protein MSIMFI_05145 [Mycobacterium simulans]